MFEACDSALLIQVNVALHPDQLHLLRFVALQKHVVAFEHAFNRDLLEDLELAVAAKVPFPIEEVLVAIVFDVLE